MKANKFFCFLSVIILLCPGCKKEIPETNTPLHHAARVGDVEQMKSLITKGADFGIIATEGKIDGTHSCYFVTGTHTLATEDTFVGVSVKGGMTLVNGKNPGTLAQAVEVLLLNSQVLCDLLQFTLTVLSTSQTITMVVCNYQFHRDTAGLIHLGRIGMHDHPISCRRGARTYKASHALDLDDTKSAGPEGAQVRVVA